MKFKELSDEHWRFIEPLLPAPASTGRPRVDDRRAVNAILYVLKTGIPWNDLPSQYGDDVTAWRRLKRWEEQGVWRRVMDALVSEGYSNGGLQIDSLSVDSTTIPAKKGVKK